MGYFKEKEIDVIDALDAGMEVDEIAKLTGLSVVDVQEIVNKYDDGEFDCDPGDMDGDDGDATYALASAGFGMDEDYGYAEDVL